MIRIEAHFFTHPVSKPTLERTMESFFQTWGEMPFTVWDNSDETAFNPTESLSDGYIQAVKGSESEYLFMMEHDWEFMGGHIDHSLPEILEAMDEKRLNHFRFNKRPNAPKVWDRHLSVDSHGDLNYCLSPNPSNNPHIVRRSSALEWIENGWIVKSTGSKGIEENLQTRNILSAIYGGLGHPATVKHLDGSKRWS